MPGAAAEEKWEERQQIESDDDAAHARETDRARAAHESAYLEAGCERSDIRPPSLL